nr:BEL1-like homeodomain protein 11 [Tanacetum cinerariifolium]
MVSPDSSSNPNNNIHQFLVSNSTHYESQPYDPYGVDLRNLGGSYSPQSLNVLPTIQSLGDRISSSVDHLQPPHITDQPSLDQHHNNHNQKLSLSLGTSLLFPPSSLNQTCSTYYGNESFIGSSRYLKPTQTLLEEIVSVGGGELDSSNKLYARKLSGSGQYGSLGLCSDLNAELCSNGLSLDKQELQTTLAKLISLLEEVERRYDQYYQQLEQVVSSFEMNAGLGSGKSYTALALNAMSGHFSSLKDAILARIYATRKKILQDFPKMNMGFSQLSLFDKEANRNNRIALQQLGMIASPRQTWRPIRGLPETSVMILRSWLFEHFLHP